MEDEMLRIQVRSTSILNTSGKERGSCVHDEGIGTTRVCVGNL